MQLLQQYGWLALAAGCGIAAVYLILPSLDLGKLASLLPKAAPKAAEPAVKASSETDPATLCEQAGSLWRIQGRGDLATKAFALSVESAAKGGGA